MCGGMEKDEQWPLNYRKSEAGSCGIPLQSRVDVADKNMLYIS